MTTAHAYPIDFDHEPTPAELGAAAALAADLVADDPADVPLAVVLPLMQPAVAGEDAEPDYADDPPAAEVAWPELPGFPTTDAIPWQERALCAQVDPEAFFPEKGGSTREAKQICTRCEVRAECLEYALDKDERFGIWGGLSERERRRLKRRTV